MTEPPKRRWFRFRLSTVLILTAIVAWGMATRPRAGGRYWIETGASSSHGTFGHLPEGGRDEPGWWTFLLSSTTSTHRELILYIGPDPQLAWPVLALAAFLAGKAAWAVVERRRRQSATPE
jgi:hypothetical protein